MHYAFPFLPTSSEYAFENAKSIAAHANGLGKWISQYSPEKSNE